MMIEYLFARLCWAIFHGGDGENYPAFSWHVFGETEGSDIYTCSNE